MEPTRIPNREEIDKAIKEHGAYINYEALRKMTEEEAAEIYDGLLNTFLPQRRTDGPSHGPVT